MVLFSPLFFAFDIEIDGLGDIILSFLEAYMICQTDLCYAGTITPNMSQIGITHLALVDAGQPQLGISSIPQKRYGTPK